MSSFIQYLREIKGELARVSWPTRDQAVMFTILVIVFSVLTSVYLGVFDNLFLLIIKKAMIL